MIKIPYILAILTLSIWSGSVNDYDMDGVPNNIDVCNHTPFFDTVNKQGCSTKRLILPDEKESNSLDIIFGYGLLNKDDIDGNRQYKSKVELDYYHNNWIYGLKSGYINSESKNSMIDTLLNIKKRFQLNQNLKFTTGLIFSLPTYDCKGNRTDYILSEALTYYPNNSVSLFLGGNYDIINDIVDTEPIHNQYSYYLGGGYFFSQKLYSSLSFSHSNNKFIEKGDINRLNSTLFYKIDNDWFSSLSYSHEILNDDTRYSLSLKVGFTVW